jgi:hypothetical protein
MRQVAALLIVLMAQFAVAAAPDLWFYQAANLLPEENIKKVEELWRRAAAAGYSHVLLADSKFEQLGNLGDNEARYRQHVARLRELATELKLQVVPAGFGIGYSNALLANDPNLAEGLPVRNALFVVHDGKARLQPEPAVSLKPKPDWFDGSYTVENGVATTHAFKGNARLVWKVAVSPYRCYHVSVKIRTQDFGGEPEIKPLVGDRVLSYTKLGVQRSQEWKEHRIVFGSLNNPAVSIYMGVWGDAQGTLQWRDWKIEEVGLVNVLRRAGTPCTVEGYTEGKDYEAIADPAMGNRPWPGEYEVWHEPPTIKTHLPEGTRLRVSWYFPTVIQDEQVGCCPSEPKVMQLLANEARQLREVWQPAGIMMSHDEVRVLNQDKSCLDRKLTPGQILADNVKQCGQILKGTDTFVWSDMFDPFHNAVNSYYLVNGDLAGSWEGLDPAVTIVNWNFGQRSKSLKFFAGRGHKQVIAGYYDGDVKSITQWLDAARDIPNVTGVMYTTWVGNYGDLEQFAKVVRAHK